MNEFNILKLSIQDFFTIRMLKLIFIPLILILIVFSLSFYFAANFELSSLSNASYLSHQQILDENNNTISESFAYQGDGTGLFQTIVKYIVTSSFFYFIVYSLGFILVVMFSNFISLIVLGFFSPIILNIIREKHYPNLVFNGYGNIFNSLLELFKSIGLFFILLIVLIPLYFIPVLNIVAFNFPFYYLFHRLIIFDVSSTVSTYEDFKKVYFFANKNLRLKTLLFFIASLVPFFTIFITLFFMIYIGHSYICLKKKYL